MARTPGRARGDLVLSRAGAGAARLRHPEGRARPFARRDRRRAEPERAPVKAALHRGRVALRGLPRRSRATPGTRATVRRAEQYASLFNAHDWDGVRSLLADDVRLDLVSQRKAAGRRDVGIYFSNYERIAGWQLAPAWFDGREVLAVLTEPQRRAALLHRAGWRGDRVASIRDFRYVSYIAQEGAFQFEGTP